MTEFNESSLKLILRAELAEFQIKLVNLFVGRQDFIALREEVHALNVPDEDDIARVARAEINQSKKRTFTTWDRVLGALVVLVVIGGFILQVTIASGK